MPIDFTMSAIPDVTLQSVVWPTVSYSVPTAPAFPIPGLEDLPDGDTPPEYAASEIPQPTYGYPTTPVPSLTQISIPTPPDIDVDDISVAVPELTASVPSASVNWAYSAFSNVLLAALEVQVALLDESIEGLWAFADKYAQTLWSEPYNPVTAFGYTDPLSTYRTKERAYGASLYQGALTALKEAITTRNLRTYVALRLDMEKQRRTQYASQKDVELAWAKDIVSKSIEHYNLLVQYFGAYVNCYRLKSAKFQAQLGKIDADLQKFEYQIAAEKLKGDVAEGIIARYEALLGARRELVRLYEYQMQTAKKLVEAEALNIDAYKSSIQVILLGLKNIVEQANQEGVNADTETMIAKLGEAQYYAEEVRNRAEAIQIDLDAIHKKYDTETAAVVSRNNVMSKYPAHLNAEAAAKGADIDARIDTIISKGDVKYAEEEADLNITLSRALEALYDFMAALDAQQKMDDKTIEGIRHAEALKQIEYDFLEVELAKAKSKIAQALKDAKLINIFTEYTSE